MMISQWMEYGFLMFLMICPFKFQRDQGDDSSGSDIKHMLKNHDIKMKDQDITVISSHQMLKRSKNPIAAVAHCGAAEIA